MKFGFISRLLCGLFVAAWFAFPFLPRLKS